MQSSKDKEKIIKEQTGEKKKNSSLSLIPRKSTEGYAPTKCICKQKGRCGIL